MCGSTVFHATLAGKRSEYKRRKREGGKPVQDKKWYLKWIREVEVMTSEDIIIINKIMFYYFYISLHNKLCKG